MKVYKFGGTSVGSADRMRKVAEIIGAEADNKVVVLSAVSGTTNTLVEIGELLLKGSTDTAKVVVKELKAKYYQIISELHPEAENQTEANEIVAHFFEHIKALTAIPDFNEGNNKTLVAFGELLSSHLFTDMLKKAGIECQLLNAFDFMSIDEDGEPEIEKIGKKLKPLIGNCPLSVTQGFICKNHLAQTDNLKRGGSDYSASIIGAAISAEEIQIWTDIDGMHNNDPRVVGQTKPIEQLTFDEAAELAYFGAKILHPTSILPAQKYDIPVLLKSTIDPAAKGTIIGTESNDIDIKAIAAKDNITAIKIKSSRMLLAHGFLKNVFEVFSNYKTPIDMITTSEVAVSLTIDDNRHLEDIIKDLEKFGTVEVDRNQTIICIVGNMVSQQQGVLKAIFDVLADIPVRMVSYGGSRHNISVLTDSANKKAALMNLNQLFVFA